MTRAHPSFRLGIPPRFVEEPTSRTISWHRYLGRYLISSVGRRPPRFFSSHDELQVRDELPLLHQPCQAASPFLPLTKGAPRMPLNIYQQPLASTQHTTGTPASTVLLAVQLVVLVSRLIYMYGV